MQFCNFAALCEAYSRQPAMGEMQNAECRMKNCGPNLPFLFFTADAGQNFTTRSRDLRKCLIEPANFTISLPFLYRISVLLGPRSRASDRTPPHRERTKASLEAATPPDWRAPPANHREHRPRPAVFLPVNPHRTAVQLTEQA